MKERIILLLNFGFFACSRQTETKTAQGEWNGGVPLSVDFKLTDK